MAEPHNTFRWFDSSPEVIQLLVMLYVRYPLSPRNVKDLAFERGIDVCQGEMRYLWRPVDHEGEVLESFVTKTRDKPAALKFMKKPMKRHGCARIITTDGLRSYKAAMNDLSVNLGIGPDR